MPDSTTCTHQTYCLMRDETDMRFISHLTRNTFAIILAGGRGSRLRQLTDFRSKPAVPFAGKFRILDFTPVSYTHLDVYKRQVQDGTLSGSANHFAGDEASDESKYDPCE